MKRRDPRITTVSVLSIAAAVLAGCAQPQHISFPTPDGGVVHADIYGLGDRGVVLAHGGRFNKESWATQAQVLAKAGFRTLAIDFRGRGRSRGGPQATSVDDVRFDVLAAVRYLHDTGVKTVSVVGASFGGWATAQAAVEATPGEIDRIVLLAASAIEEPERMKGRKLFITTRDDFSGNGVLRLPEIRDQYERALQPKQLVILDGSAHAQYIFETDQAQRLMREILRFLCDP
ncbi:MAG: alpha/beta fold hydrolase [Phycisphaerales bacterium]